MIVFVGLAVDFMQRAMRRRAYKGREGEEVEMLPSTPELEMGMGKEEMYSAYVVARATRGEEVVKRWRGVMVGTGLCSIMIIVRGGSSPYFFYRRLELMGFLEKASTDL